MPVHLQILQIWDLSLAAFAAFDGRVELVTVTIWPLEAEIFTIWPFTAKVRRLCPEPHLPCL